MAEFNPLLENLKDLNTLSEEDAKKLFQAALFNTTIVDDEDEFESVIPETDATLPIFGDVKSASTDDLLRVVTYPDTLKPELVEAAQLELEQRESLSEQTFLESLTDPEALKRAGLAALKTPAQLYNSTTNALPALSLLGTGSVLGDETATDAGLSLLDDFSETNETINTNFGTPDPETLLESLGEASFGALVPGGLLAKSAGMAADFAVDQTVRELTDDPEINYATIFDRMGFPELNPVAPVIAIPAAITAGAFTQGSLNVLRNRRAIKPPKLRNIFEIDKNAPDDLKTLETSTDVAVATIVDDKQALKRIVERSGVHNIDEIDLKLNIDSGAAVGIRVREATKTGDLTVGNQSYKLDTPIRTLYKSYKNLPGEIQHKIATYINIYDQLDDARLALKEGRPGNHHTTIAQLTSVASSLEKDLPLVIEFAKKYKKSTNAVRNFLQDNVITKDLRKKLDIERPNYVPVYEGNIDPETPLLQRLNDASRDSGISIEDAFLQKRAGIGSQNPETRVDPFNALIEYTEKALSLGVNNQTRLTIVDAIAGSTFGKETIRLVKKGDDLVKNAKRVVEVFRNGVKEKYITSELVASLLKFDPHIAKHPYFYIPKRVFEYNVVGPASRTFAGVSMIRDILAAPVVRPKGSFAPNPVQVVAAIPKQVYAKTLNGLARNLEAGLLSNTSIIPDSIWPTANRQALADLMSKQYLNSIYHQAQKVGGIDASDMRTNIEVAKTTFQELGRTLDQNSNKGLTRVVRNIGYEPVKNIISMFVSLYDSVLDAPRFAAFEKNLKKGLSEEQSAAAARNLVGDTSRSGKQYLADGSAIRGDTVDQGLQSLLVNNSHMMNSFLQEGSPFVNPMIQGTRRVIEAFKEDPSGTMLRAWLYVGLPTMASYAWNELLGKEYNNYAMDNRSASDIAMRPMYIGVPGKPPEEGIEIDIAHELMLFASPFTRAVHAFARSEEGDETSFALQHLLKTIAENSVAISTPTLINAGSAAAGLNLPDTLIGKDALTGGYQIREDDIGYFSQNIEAMLKELFGINANTAIQFASVMSGDNDENNWNDYLTGIINETAARAPIIRNVTGRKTSNIAFSIPSEYDREKFKAITNMENFLKTVNEDYKTTAGLQNVRKNKPSKTHDLLPDDYEDLPIAYIGPNAIGALKNPLVAVFGNEVKANAKNNNIGMKGLSDRIQIYNKIVKNLKGYHSGNRQDGEEWKQLVQRIQQPTTDVTDAKVKAIIDQLGLDVNDYQDRVRLINIFENERSFLIKTKLSVYESVEASITQNLRDAGLIKPDEKFQIEDHLDPKDDSPLGINEAAVIQAIQNGVLKISIQP